MGKTISSFVLLALIILLVSCFYLQSGTALDAITPSTSLKDPEVIISQGGVFRLGFFSLADSSDRYVGILYNHIPVQTVVWVANRNKPLKDSSGILKISDDGNLVILNRQQEILWSSNVTNIVSNTTAMLLDTGNLVLKNDDGNGRNLWESFQHPSNGFIETMKISTNSRTGQKVELKSWKSPSDPSSGNFSLSLEPLNIPECFIWNNNQQYSRSGPWNGHIFIGFISMTTVYRDGFYLVADEQEETYYLTYYNSNKSMLTYFELDSQGKFVERNWDAGKGDWENKYPILQHDCDIYGKCGSFGSCDSTKLPICSCLQGFEPKNKEEWKRGKWTSGCVRTTPLKCQSVNNGSEAGQGDDGFLKLEMMKVPAYPEWSSIIYDNCEDQCLKNCSCEAYAYDAGIGCMFWGGDLIDIQKFPIRGVDLYIRLASSELDTKKDDSRVIVITTVIAGIVIITISAFFLWCWMAKQRGKKQKSKQIKLQFNKGNAMAKFSSDNVVGENSIEVKLQQLPLFNFEELATATNDFHHSKMLGQGGFGPVYRVMDDFQPIHNLSNDISNKL